jgi:hypothetical protein
MSLEIGAFPLERDVNKRQTNNLRSCFMREIFLNVFDEKVLTELNVDFRCVRRMNEPNQSVVPSASLRTSFSEQF